MKLKKFFIVMYIFLLTACSSFQYNAQATLPPSFTVPEPMPSSTTTSAPTLLVTNTPTQTLTPIAMNKDTSIPSWPTQTPLPSIQSGQSFVLTKIDMIDENIGWSVDATGHILRTNDGGYSWRNVTSPEVGYFSIGDASHAWNVVETMEHCERLGCSGGWVPGFAVWQTSNGGQTWQRGSFFNGIDTDFVPRAMQFIDDTNGWLLFVNKIGMSGFTYESLVKTRDSGESWVLIYPFSNGCVSSGMIFLDEQNGWIADDCRWLWRTSSGTTLADFLKGNAAPILNKTSNGGNTWDTSELPAPVDFPSNLKYSDIDTNIQFYCGTKRMEQIAQETFMLQWSCTQGDPLTSAEILYAYLTSNGGQTWHSWLSTGNESFVNPNTGWRLITLDDGQPNSLQQTIDGGLTWTTIKTIAWQSAQFEFTSERVGWAIVSGGTNFALVHTVDGGKTWIEIKPVIAQ